MLCASPSVRENLTLIIAIVFTVGSSPAMAQTAGGSSRFTDGRPGLGGGVTYQFDGTRAAYLGVFTWTWSHDRFEIGAIRFADGQLGKTVSLANPNWTFQISRRWTFIRTPEAKLFIGLGGAYKTEMDDLNGSRLNFAEQLGVRITRSDGGAGFEIAVRHMSNAGLKKPNKGQDFITVIYVF
jgi:Lipid A 3-O-deacylase (PagL)